MAPPEGTTENTAAPAAGAPAAASSGVSSGQTPGTMTVSSGTASEAMIKAAMSASSAESTPAAAKAGDTPPAAGAGDSGATSGASGQPKVEGQPAIPAGTGEAPENRIQAATKNARTKAFHDIESHLGISLKDTSPQDIRDGLLLLKRISTPEGIRAFVADLNRHIGGNGKTPQPAAAGDEQFPEADLISPDGKLKTHSDSNIAKMLDIHGKRERAKLMEELAPVLDFVNQEQDNRGVAEKRQQAATLVKETLTHARSLKGFKENEAAIQAAMKAMDKRTIQAIGPVAAMYIAYNKVLAETVYPTQEAAIETRLRSEFTKKAAAGTGQGSTTTQGGDAKKPELTNPTQLAAHMERLAAQAST